jgi:allantoinase
LSDVANWLCIKPAMLPGLNDKKGRIETGYDADLVIWNPEESFVVDVQMIHHRHKATPYLGQTLKGVVHQTYIKGEKVYDNGNFTALKRGTVLVKGKNNLNKR